MASYTEAYFKPYEPVWERLFFKKLKVDPHLPWIFVEIGSYEGYSASWIMRNILRNPGSRLYCIDRWPGGAGGDERYQRFLSNIGELERPDCVEVLRQWSADGLRELFARGVKADFLYVDGGHDAATVLKDLVLGFDVVKPGGVVICDDYLWSDPQFGGGRTLGRPKIAIDAFTTIYWDRLKIISGMPNAQTYFQKLFD
jgi:predicted O-methyltransferase YrrM